MPQQRIRAYCPLCISRCGCIATVEGERLLRVEPDPEHPTGGSFCIKGRAAPEMVDAPDRVLFPLRRTRPKGDPDPGWERISWEEALDLTAREMTRLARAHGAESVAFSVTTPSGTAVADAMPWIFRLINAFGSPNTVFTSHICNWHKDFATALTVGAESGMPDYEKTGCILHWGFNAANCWPAQATATNRAVKRGAKLIVVDPRRSGLARRADLWLRVRPGTDGALMLGIAGELIARDGFDRTFMAEWSNGPFLVREDNGCLLTGAELGADPGLRVMWDERQNGPVLYDPARGGIDADGCEPALTGRFRVATAAGALECRPAFERYAELCRAYPPERVEAITGVPAEKVRQAARLLHEHGPVSYYAWSGVGQATNATQTSRALCLLHALTGDIDAPGGNVYFTRPALNNVFGFELMEEAQRARALGADAHPLGPHARGWITTRELYSAVGTGEPYPVRGLIAFGSNLLATRPRPDQGGAALAALDFYAHCDLHLNPTARYADVVLPVASPWERSGLMGGFAVDQKADARLQLRAPVIPPRGESKPETGIVFELARRLGLGGHFFGGDMEAALRHVLEPSGVPLERLREHPEGVQLPLETRYHKYRESGFRTPSRRVEVYSERLQAAGQPPLPEYVEPATSPRSQPEVGTRFPLVLTSAKRVPYCHSQHRNIPRLRRHAPEPQIELHPQTAAERAIGDGDEVLVSSPHGEMRARVRLDASLDTGVVCAQYGWWSTDDGGSADANYAALIGNEAADPVSGSLALRSYLCEVRPVSGARKYR